MMIQEIHSKKKKKDDNIHTIYRDTSQSKLRNCTCPNANDSYKHSLSCNISNLRQNMALWERFINHLTDDKRKIPRPRKRNSSPESSSS